MRQVVLVIYQALLEGPPLIHRTEMEGISPAVLIKIRNQVIVSDRHFLRRFRLPLLELCILATIPSKEISIAVHLPLDFLRVPVLQNIHRVFLLEVQLSRMDQVTNGSGHFSRDLIEYLIRNRQMRDSTITQYVTGPDKTGLIALFCISRNTIFNIECTVLLWWLDTVTPDILYNKCSYIAIIS